MDTKETAEALHITPQRVAQLIRDGVLDAKKEGRCWIISNRSVEMILKARQNAHGNSLDYKREIAKMDSCRENVSRHMKPEAMNLLKKAIQREGEFIGHSLTESHSEAVSVSFVRSLNAIEDKVDFDILLSPYEVSVLERCFYSGLRKAIDEFEWGISHSKKYYDDFNLEN